MPEVVESSIATYDDAIMDLGDLDPAHYNPRKDLKPGDPQYESIKASILDFGYKDPMVWNRRTGRLVGGHQRLKILRELGFARAKVVVVDVDETTEIRLNVALNNATGENDEAKLSELLTQLRDNGCDIKACGFDEKRLNDMLRRVASTSKLEVVEVEVPEVPAEPIVKPGEIWLLGKHRLMCGDSTKAEDVSRLMCGKRAILFATDPPYLVDYDGTNHPHAWDKPDNNKDWSGTYGAGNWDESGQSDELYDKFIQVAIDEAIRPDAAWYCWHAFRRQAMLEEIWNKHGAFTHQQIIWAKDRAIISHSWYMWQHEPCFFGWVKGNKPPRAINDFQHTVWQIPTIAPGTKTDHPTSKPVKVFAIPMEQHTFPGDICYEPFSGSGSQIIAAEQLDRVCYAMEISPVYCDVAIKRWETLTGRKAVRADA